MAELGDDGEEFVNDKISHADGFDRDVISSASGEAEVQADLRGIITAIARASHDIADLVSLGRLAPPRGRLGANGAIDVETNAALNARHILIEHLDGGCVDTLHCAGEEDAIRLDTAGGSCGGRLYAVSIDPLEGAPDPDANLPFGTIFCIAAAEGAPGEAPLAAGFIHYGPQTNLVLALGAGVHIFNLDRPTRTYRLAAENVRIPDQPREWAIDATKRGRWPGAIRALIDEHLEEADTPGGVGADMRWTGSITSDAYRILRRGGVYICPEDDQPGREESAPNLRHAARPIAFIVEQAGGCATTGDRRVVDMEASSATQRTPMIFGSCCLVERFKRLHALPESLFDGSPLFRKRGLFRVEAD